MVSLLTEFHFALKDIPKFDIGKDGFSIKEIYDYYMLKHARSPIQMMNDSLFMPKLEKFCKSKDEYEGLWIKTKRYSQLVTNLYSSANPPEPIVEMKEESKRRLGKAKESAKK
eukprot:TRINITY_DN12427_c0_g2_i1.p1 TRINITY_DN12427_c0_g2~~TRINITY_DN12427_c0_g2_i1.p1  ORF type:complete len:113 (-),score=43.08 TRINITY_DN12427_c0_g2_i1:128-466(-)